LGQIILQENLYSRLLNLNKQIMLRNIFSIVILLGFSIHLFGQENTEKVKLSFTHELGINATHLINKLIHYNSDTLNNSPYYITYRLGHGNWGVRVGIGGSRKYSEIKQKGYADSKSSLNYRFDARIGIDYQVQFGKRFVGNFGLDLVKRSIVSDDIDDSGYDKIEVLNQFHGYGFGPVAGIKYMFNSHLSLYTEASFYMIYGNTDNARIFKNFPELNDNILQSTSAELNTVLTSGIFLIYQF